MLNSLHNMYIQSKVVFKIPFVSPTVTCPLLTAPDNGMNDCGEDIGI